MELAGGHNWRKEWLIRGKGIIGWLDQSIFPVYYNIVVGLNTIHV
jgi:hypothetical protein